jgi:hypothetical protein
MADTYIDIRTLLRITAAPIAAHAAAAAATINQLNRLDPVCPATFVPFSPVVLSSSVTSSPSTSEVAALKFSQ